MLAALRRNRKELQFPVGTELLEEAKQLVPGEVIIVQLTEVITLPEETRIIDALEGQGRTYNGKKIYYSIGVVENA